MLTKQRIEEFAPAHEPTPRQALRTDIRRMWVGFGVLALIAFVSCSSGKHTTSASPTASVVTVALSDFDIAVSPTSAPAGPVTFRATNAGKHVHEFVVLKTDVPAGSLTTKPDGSANEDATGVTNVGELEDVKPGTSETKTLTLQPGKYVFICNIVEQHTTMGMPYPAHYKMGMRAAFVVT